VATRLIPNGTGIDEAIEVLQRGGLVAFPTDTVYGLGAHAFLPEAVQRIYEAKARPTGKPIPLLVPDALSLGYIAAAVPDAAWKLTDAFWPGALTIVVASANRVPAVVTQGKSSIAVRSPNHPVAQALLRGVGSPLAVTSANISGTGSLTTAQEVFEALQDRVDLVLDGGASPIGIESTIIDLTTTRPRLLRAGAISIEDLNRVLAPLTIEFC
jgi:L-threonylcarbamoyladenylate synthase